MSQQTDIHIGQRVNRSNSDVEGTITRRDGDRYHIEYDDGGQGFVLVSAMEAGHAQWLSRFAAPHRQNRAREARATLEAIRRGDAVDQIIQQHHAKSVKAAASELTEADKAKILARLSSDGKKAPTPVSPPAPQKPASAQPAKPDGEFAQMVAKHVRRIVGAKG